MIVTQQPTMINMGDILDNRSSKPNPLEILKTDELKLTNLIQNYEWSKMFKITDIKKATLYFTEKIIVLTNGTHLKYPLTLKP